MKAHPVSIPMAMMMICFASGSTAIAQQSESGQPARPFLLVEGEFDRKYVSDLYTFTMDGKLIKRLTNEPLPSISLVAVAPVLGDPYFEGGALYSLSLRHNMLMAVHAGPSSLVPAVSLDGKTSAFITEPVALPGSDTGAFERLRAGDRSAQPLVLRVQPVVADSPWRRPIQMPLPAGVVPTEMTFTPDGEQVLITHWPGNGTAQLLLVDLSTGDSHTVLASEGLSYYAPAFAPDGKSLLAVREDFAAGRWAVVSLAWPDGKEPTAIVTAPRGASLSTPIFLADGKRFLFHQDDTLVRATLDGRIIEPIFGSLDQKGREWNSHVADRRRPVRAGWIPQVVNRYFARVEWHERVTATADPAADLIVIDVQTGQQTRVPMPSDRIRMAVVVE